MKALVYRGPRDVKVQNVPDPKIEDPKDVIIKVHTTNICGSDLHMYEGRTTLEEGRVLGHENVGEVIEVGKNVWKLKKGDWVCVPFNVSCGACANCERGLTGYCLVTNTTDPHTAGAALGFAGMGPYNGGQAEYLRVPFGDFNCLRLPEDAPERQIDYVMLADIFPTGYHATELARMRPGDSVVIYGAGPVGLMAAYSAVIKGASKIMVVDRHSDRLALAEKIGAIPIDFSKVDPVEEVLKLTRGRGADSGCECVGYQAQDAAGNEQANITLNNLVHSVKFTGGIGVVGVFVPEDPGAQDELGKQGKLVFDYGMYWFKGQSMATGQTNVKAYNRQLLRLVTSGKALPSFVVSHELPLSSAPEAYKHFDRRDHGWTKVCLKPHL
ncbi:glutathione-independent formaldehyde dehydrogenase [Nannocystis sp. ILAH1]|uniref:glutathione-independent formaldehyde dehydrogenase n=1 Tax=unclassified Nannocystis TaxID=2627009 RepID=UPI0022712567|nr:MULTISPECIES: glutathione-independent formaldehyde dehydrogenase [unclassified Nannocystis]MCY0991093.1 glutathione-independent formaldehyde dehydrogenase [Nannocystis sp. ILAH1]MCY1064605.1 glutathione-independent formaldehyde dehydrogenase [Nannocystis sp. RBIL2]